MEASKEAQEAKHMLACKCGTEHALEEVNKQLQAFGKFQCGVCKMVWEPKKLKYKPVFISKNAPCHCGSGKKNKRCCGMD